MIALSPGLLQGCVELLQLVSRSRLMVVEVQASFPTFSGSPTSEILKAAQELRWLHVTDVGVLEVTSTGTHLVNAPAYEAMLRRAILDYVDIERPAWLQAALSGRARVMAFAGPKIAQVMVEAGLNAETTVDVVSFWDELAARARGLRDSRLMTVGRLGERLTLVYEEARTGVPPKWVSLEDNDDGYDVLSIKDREDRRPLSIETKTSTVGPSGLAHITRNEWDRALDYDLHLFHLWDVSCREAPLLAVVPPKKMLAHIPTDCGSGEWELARIPFAVFTESFSKVMITLLEH